MVTFSSQFLVMEQPFFRPIVYQKMDSLKPKIEKLQAKNDTIEVLKLLNTFHFSYDIIDWKQLAYGIVFSGKLKVLQQLFNTSSVFGDVNFFF